MAIELKPIKYVEYKVYNVTSIKGKYGFRVALTLGDKTKRPVQHAGFDKRDLAEKERYKVIGQLENETYVVYTDVTVETYMKYWFEYIISKRLNSSGSVDTYKNSVFNYIIPNIGKLKLVDLKSGHIKKLYKQVYECYPSVARILQTVMSTSLTDAVVNKFIPTNVAKEVRLPIKEVSKEKYESNYHTLTIDEKKTYTIEEVAILIKCSRKSPIYLHVLFAVLMGLRKGEINRCKIW